MHLKNLLFLIYCNVSFCQVIHHQMLSTGGNITTINGNLIVLQTIGQLSVININTNSSIVNQGFQHPINNKTYSQIVNIELEVYPNPFSNYLNIKFDEINNASTKIEILDIYGKKIYSNFHLIENHVVTINLSYLPSATYFIIVNYNNKKFNAKIIKQ